MNKVTDAPDKEEMKTLSQCTESLRKHGFENNFRVEGKELKTENGDKAYQPNQVSIVNFYRFEGESDPADSAILYAIQTDDGLKGMLSDAFGTYANSNVSEFISGVEEIEKKHQPQ